MPLVCEQINEWVEEQVSKPVEEWVEKEEKKCKKKKCKKWCLCCNKWFCWIETFIVKVVTWVVVTIGKWVIRTVCKVIAATVDFIKDAFVGIFNILIGIFTLNWGRIRDGFGRILGGLFSFALKLLRIGLLGDTIDFIRDEINKSKLRKYVAKLLEAKYSGDELKAIKEALSVDHGAFGFRIKVTAYRSYVRSDYRSEKIKPPDLILWHEDPNAGINLKELSGYEYSNFWNRFRPEVIADSGEFSESDMEEYISSRGSTGKNFSIFCMDKDTLQTKLDTASEKGIQIGLMPQWHRSDIQVTKAGYVRQQGNESAICDFLIEVIRRHRKTENETLAREELCALPAVGVFLYADDYMGYSAHLYDSTCLNATTFPGSETSGVTFRDRIPDWIWKYVPIHEIGHYFGLCHVDGLERIMFSNKTNSKFSWWTIPEYIYLEGGPRFTLAEGKKAWDYIVSNFSSLCLSHRAE
jgi:hypothetical protein